MGNRTNESDEEGEQKIVTSPDEFNDDESQNDEYDESHDSLSESSLLIPAIPLTEDLIDDDDDSGVAYLLSVRREAHLIDIQNSMTSSCSQGTLNGNRVSCNVCPKTVLQEKPMDPKKRRCDYLEVLLHLDKRAADSPVPKGITRNVELEGNSIMSNIGQSPDSTSQQIDDELWKEVALNAFKEFREFLEILSSAVPELSGEGEVVPEQRDWAEDKWDAVIVENDASMIDIGAMDNVRAVAVLESVANYLKCSNKELASVSNLHGQPDLINAIKPSMLVCRRVLRWAFAGLANLDLLQSVDADVAHVLQVIRRCCRWFRGILGDPELQGDVRLVEIVIQDFFRQR